jgi:uncharacterized membrane protein
MPTGIQPFAALIVTYLTAAFFSVILFFITSENKSIIPELHKVHWLSFIYGFAIIGLELGYLYVYKVGWKISTGSLVANISLACILLVVGAILYKENISIRQLLGIVLCMTGIFLVSK